VVWHRRAGKDSTAINLTAKKMMERVGTYWHLLPEAKQGRKVIWDAIDREGRRVIDQAFPPAMRASTNSVEMQIKAANGSVWQVVGSDNYNSLVGANPVGVVFSEFSIANPAAWDFIRPILAENGGWALFIFTPRGKNHAHKLFLMAKDNGEWFAEVLTVDDTLVIPPEVIAKERAEGMDDDLIEQEYFCSWVGSTKGAIYGEQIRRARAQNRITQVPYTRAAAVNTFWDIGHSDQTAIWFHQNVGVQHRFIDCYANTGQDLAHYVAEMRAKPYLYGTHYLPHDAKNVTLASKSNPLGDNVFEQLIGLGVNPSDIVLVPRTPDVWAAISATRLRWDEVWMDEEACEAGLNALTMYRKKWNDEKQAFDDAPYHDWASNYSDAFRQWAQGWKSEAGLKTFTAPNMLGRTLPGAGVVTVGNKRIGY
jgi:hypothetical protein